MGGISAYVFDDAIILRVRDKRLLQLQGSSLWHSPFICSHTRILLSNPLLLMADRILSARTINFDGRRSSSVRKLTM